MPLIAPLGVKGFLTPGRGFWELPLGQTSVRQDDVSSHITKKTALAGGDPRDTERSKEFVLPIRSIRVKSVDIDIRRDPTIAWSLMKVFSDRAAS